MTPPAAGQALQRAAQLDELDQIRFDRRLRADESVPAGERLYLDYGGIAFFSYLSVDDALHRNHGVRESDFFGYLRANLDGAQEFFLRARVGYQDFNTGTGFTGHDDQPVEGDLDRAFYRLDLRRYNQAYGLDPFGGFAGPRSDSDLVFQGGRDLVYWANGLVLARVLDGVNVDVSSGPFDAQFIAGVTPVRTVDFDTSRPGFYYNTRRGFFGTMLGLRTGQTRPFAYALLQRDFNRDEVANLGVTRARFSYNSSYLGAGATGTIGDHFKYGMEAAFEQGNTFSRARYQFSLGGPPVPLPQTRDAVRAFAFDATLDYLPLDAHNSRLSAEVILASGDPDRGASSFTSNGNAPYTGDLAFNAFGLLNTGLAFSDSVSNLAVLRLGASTFPLPGSGLFSRLQVGADFFVIAKYRAHAPINEPTGNRHFLGLEPDLYLNWQAASDVTFALRYGIFLPSARAFPGNDAARQLFYASVTYAF